MADRWSGHRLGDWVVGKFLGGGGSGVVYQAEREGRVGAIKVLKQRFWGSSRYARFKDEVRAMQACEAIPGVLPLLDSNIPETPSRDNPPWIVMAFAQPLADAVGSGATLSQVVGAMAEVAETLAAMHEKNFEHRDIKPANLYYYGNRFCVGDLGLVTFEDKDQVTEEGEKIGPVYYIAPEMLNSAIVADAQPADVYSLAKTLWVLTTGQKYPLPGEMTRSNPAMTVSAYVQEPRAVLLDRFIEAATSFDPRRRPSMRTAAGELRSWLTPSTATMSSGDLDLSLLIDEIDAINEPVNVKTKASDQEQQQRRVEGLRLRDLFRSTATEITDTLEKAKFIKCRLFIDKVQYGFNLIGSVATLRGDGDIMLRLICSIDQSEAGQAKILCEYRAEINRASGRAVKDLWHDVATFLIGGSQEGVEVARLISGMRRQLRPSVDEVIRLAKEP